MGNNLVSLSVFIDYIHSVLSQDLIIKLPLHHRRPEEQLVFAKLVFVWILDQPGNNVLTGASMVSFCNILGPAENAVPHIEVVVGPPANMD